MYCRLARPSYTAAPSLLSWRLGATAVAAGQLAGLGRVHQRHDQCDVRPFRPFGQRPGGRLADRAESKSDYLEHQFIARE